MSNTGRDSDMITRPRFKLATERDDANVACLSSDCVESLNTGEDSSRSTKQEMGPNRLRKGEERHNASGISVTRRERLSTGTSKDIRSKYAGLKVFRKPYCLIKNDDNGKLSIVEEIMEEISSIDDTVNVIAIAGPYRTGKSYLLNRLAKAKRGFPLGNTTDAATKGIWVWCLEHPERKDEVMMLLDTEGIGDVMKEDDKNDNNILCLTTLLSGIFVYNIFGVLDGKFLKDLSFVVQISKKIVLTNTLPEDDLKFIPEIGFFFPSFVLCLRDFFLEMANGETPDMYFEKCLQLKTGDEKKTTKYNLIRLSILENFRNRRCFTFDRPAAGRGDLARLETLREWELQTAFLADTKLFVEYMYSCKPKKLIDGSLLNGRMFSSLAKQYLDSIRSGKVPCIDDALTIMSKQENEIALEKAVDLFKNQIESIQLPLPDDFELRHKQAQRDALRAFRKMAVLDDKQSFQKKAQDEMDTIKMAVEEKNRAYLIDVCSKELQTRYDISIKPKVTKGVYFESGGYKLYREDFAKLRENVKQSLPSADSNLLQMCALEFEGRYRKQDEDILEKADMTESQIKAEMKEQYTKLEREKSKLMQNIELKRKEDAEQLENYKREMLVQMDMEKQELKEVYKKLVRDWQNNSEDLKTKLNEYADLISQLRAPKMKTTQDKKPPMAETVIKTMISLIPVIGPIATGIYERYKST